MDFRLANMDDLIQLKSVFRSIVDKMNNDDIHIWDDIYPCEFLSEDIEYNRLYVLIKDNEIVSAFALCNSSDGEDYVKWENKNDKALYIYRFGVNINYLRQGIGNIMLNKAITLSKEKRVNYLRLFVVDSNYPAINFYLNNGFKQVDGFYDDIINDEIELRELGFETKTIM